MNLLKKCKTVFFLLMGVTVALVSCKDKTDLSGTMMDIAEGNLVNKQSNTTAYSYTVVDTVNSVTTVYEYTLKRGVDGADNTGTYRVVVFKGADGTYTMSTRNFTWTRGEFTDQNLAIDLTITYEDGEQAKMKWSANSIVDPEGLAHPSGARADVVYALAQEFPNHTWKYSKLTDLYIDTTYDTIPYIAFVQKTGVKVSREFVDSVNAVLQSAEIQEAIAWFNDNFDIVKEHDASLSKVTYDTVQVRKINIPLTGGDTTYNCVYMRSYNDTIIRLIQDTLGAGEVVTSSLIVESNANTPTTGYYEFSDCKYERAYYEGDLSKKEVVSDTAYSFSKWTFGYNGTLFNKKSFSLVYMTDDNKPSSISISDLDLVKGTLKIGDYKYQEVLN